ncbi:MAG: hypothetical protein IKN16_06660 [Selenomonadaceae bacterium]|nr:hypothetical protein [Selenomonadaceae bacterium]
MINLTDDLYLGTGMHKVVYVHPTDKNLCIKILHTAPDEDLEREFRYRKSLGKRADSMTLITKYFGEVETSRGKGYLFERVVDYDGNTSRDMLDLFEATIKNKKNLPAVEKILLDFKRVYFAEKIPLAGIDASNYLVQKISPSEYRVRIIDNIGTSAFIPLAYYFDFFAMKRARKYWRLFMKEVGERYRVLFSEEFLRKLAEI